MSAPAPANRRSASGSRRFNPLKVLQPKRRLQQILASSPIPVPKQASGSGVDVPAATAPVVAPVPAAPAGYMYMYSKCKPLIRVITVEGEARLLHLCHQGQWFDYCRFIELDYVPMETGYMVSMRPTKGYPSTKSPTKGYSVNKSPSRSTASPSTPRSRRAPAAASNRDPFGNNTVSSSSNSGSCKGSDCSPTKGRHQKYTSCTDNHGIRPPPPEQYLTPLQQKEVCIRHLRAKLKETIHTLQDRDSEIDELRGRLCRMQEDWFEEECHRVEAQLALKEARQEIQHLKQAVDTVRDRLSDAGGLGGDIGVQRYFHDINTQNHKLENLLLNMELAQAGLSKEVDDIPGFRTRVGGSAPASVSGESPGGIPKPVDEGRGSCSCDASPARSLTRSSTYTKLSEKAADRNGNGTDFPSLSAAGTQDSGFVCCGEVSIPSRADLLLEAAFLSEETASLLNSYTQTFAHTLPNSLSHTYPHTLPRSFPHNMSTSVPHSVPHSSTYEKLCTSDRLAPFRCGLGGVGCMSHPCLSHHHLYLHPLREAGIQTESCPIPATAGYPSDLDTIAEQRTFRSQACSPTSTWLSDEGDEELDSITTTTSVTTATVMSAATEPIPISTTPLVPSIPRSATVACSMESSQSGKDQMTEKAVDEIVLIEETKISVMEEGQQGGSLDGSLVEGQNATLEVQHLEGTITETQPLTLHFTSSLEETPESLNVTDVNEVQQLLDSNQVEKEVQSAEQPRTSQPRRSPSSEEIAGIIVMEVHDSDGEDVDDRGHDEASGNSAGGGESSEESGPIQRSYWSRHFLVDLLAVAIPVVPTVAWLCRGPIRAGQPMYHIGSLLRGCCTVALHSLRRGGGLRHYPAGGGEMGGSII